MKSEFCVTLITAPTGGVARRIAEQIIASRLAACVNIVPTVESLYWWKGKRERAKEALLIVKTRKSLFKKLADKVRRIHPYDVPEIIALPIQSGNAAYLQWLNDETR